MVSQIHLLRFECLPSARKPSSPCSVPCSQSLPGWPPLFRSYPAICRRLRPRDKSVIRFVPRAQETPDSLSTGNRREYNLNLFPPSGAALGSEGREVLSRDSV